jgi:hypothetical protein
MHSELQTDLETHVMDILSAKGTNERGWVAQKFALSKYFQ